MGSRRRENAWLLRAAQVGFPASPEFHSPTMEDEWKPSAAAQGQHAPSWKQGLGWGARL